MSYSPHPGYQAPQRREERLAAVEAEAVELRQLFRMHAKTFDNVLTTLGRQKIVNDELHDRITYANKGMTRIEKGINARLWCLLILNIGTIVAVGVLISKANIAW